MIAVIAAYAEQRVIGKNGCIPWELAQDKHRFRDLTMGSTIIMGRTTFEEIGRPLPGRETIVISRTKCFDQPHCITVPDLAHALHAAETQDIFICGGQQLYEMALPLADVLYLTEIHEKIDGDRFFPKVREEEFIETEREDRAEELPYTFRTLQRRQMNYAQARDYIAQLTKQKGIVLGLEPMKRLLNRLGDPQNCYPVVHIAGTNGKGSTLAMTASILRAAGYRVGTYHSPAVFEPLECWQTDGIPITPEQYAAGMTKIRAVCEHLREQGYPIPTAFEQETALAFWFLAQQHCDIAVVECGMGGLEDATNVLSTTAVSVLTAVGMDHTRFLGDSLARIARTKAGIFKKNIPAVVQNQEESVLSAVREAAQKIGAPLTISQPRDVQRTPDGIQFAVDGSIYTTALTARYQADNAAAAVTAVKQLPLAVSEKAIQEGLHKVQWHGRMEQIADKPVIVLDGAHNPNAAKRLREEVQQRWKPEQLIEIVGVLADKDFTQVGKLMTPLARKIITVTPPNNPRALSAQELADCLRKLHPDVTAAQSVREALHMALDAADEHTAILAFGSLSWLGAMRSIVEEEL